MPRKLVLAAALLALAAGGAWLALRDRPPSDAPRLAGPATLPGANLLVVTLDTTRADRIGGYGYPEAETPNLDALAREGVRFAQAVTSIPLTLPAHASLFTGSDPLHHRVRDNGGFFLAKERMTLAEALEERGYATGAFVSSFVLNANWGLDQGFDVYDDDFGPDDPRAAADLHEQRIGGETTDRALAWLDTVGKGSFFAWVHLYDPHYPYEPPPPYDARHPGRPYDGEIAYADAQVGRLLDRLRRDGTLERTLVVVIGDHGEGLGDHGEPDHGIFVYDSTLLVPLLVRTPETAYRGVVRKTVRDKDVMPTILDYLGVPVPEGVLGKSLLPVMSGETETEERWAYAESFYVRYHYGWKEVVALRGDRYKLIDLPRPELYDLAKDPGETRNLADVQTETLAELKGRLEAMRAGDAGELQRPDAVDPDTLARLQSLGYLGASPAPGTESLADPKDKREAIDVLIRASRETGAAMRSGRFAEAAATVERAVALEPNFLDGWQFLGTLYLRLGRPDDAIAALRKILDVNPESLQAQMALAKAYEAKGDPRTALAFADRVIASTPTYVAAYYAASDALAELGRFGEAAARMEALLRERPDAHGARYEIGRLLLRAGRPREAERAIEDAVAGEPRLRSAHFNLALLAEARGDVDRALRFYETEVELFPTNHEAWANLGILRMQRGEIEAGVRAFERLAALRPEDALAHYLLARGWMSAGRVDDAVAAEAARAVFLEPGNPRYRALAAEIAGRRSATRSP